MKRANHILVGTDFSEQADIALAEAVRLARRHNSTLTLVHVIDEVPADSRWMVFGVPPADIEASLRKRAEAELQARVEQFGEGIRLEAKILVGKPSFAILDHARELDVGLLIVGRTGESLLERLLLGSTAERLLRLAPRMTMVVRPDKEPGFQRIVCPVDFSEFSKDALGVAARIAKDEGSELHVLHAYEYAGLAQIASATSIDASQTFQQELEKQATEQLTELLEEVDLLGVTPITHMRVGVADQEIVEFAKREDCDLIVMGSVGRTGMKRLLLGNTAERVVRNSPCSLLAVRPKPKAE